MILVGGGARHAAAEIRRLAQQLTAPVVSFRGGRGIVSSDDPLGFSCAEGFELWPDTDVLLAVGTRQELAWFRWPDRPAGLVVINLDIDPAQHIRLEPTIGLTADARDGTAHLLRLLAGVTPGHPEQEDGPDGRTSRFERPQAAKDRVRAELQTLQPHLDHLTAIRDVLPDDGYLVEEICQVGFASIVGFPVRRPRQFITAGCQGTLGFGFPTALGVKAADRSAPVVSLVGDGGFLFGVQELATAVQYNLGVVTVVFDNAAFGNVKNDQQRLYQRVVGADLVNPDFVAMARSFGADGYEVSGPEQLRPTLERALATDRPAVVHVPMPLDPQVSPWRFLMPAPRGA